MYGEAINDQALDAFQELGVAPYLAYQDIRHTLTDYSAFGLPAAHPQTVKGVARSYIP